MWLQGSPAAAAAGGGQPGMAHASQPAAAKAGPPYGTQASCRQCTWRTSHGRNPDFFIYLCTYPKVPTPFRTHTQPHPTQAAPDTALPQHTPGRPTLAVTQLGTTGAARGGMATNSDYPAHAPAAAAAGTKSTDRGPLLVCSQGCVRGSSQMLAAAGCSFRY